MRDLIENQSGYLNYARWRDLLLKISISIGTKFVGQKLLSREDFRKFDSVIATECDGLFLTGNHENLQMLVEFLNDISKAIFLLYASTCPWRQLNEISVYCPFCSYNNPIALRL